MYVRERRETDKAVWRKGVSDEQNYNIGQLNFEEPVMYKSNVHFTYDTTFKLITIIRHPTVSKLLKIKEKR